MPSKNNLIIRSLTQTLQQQNLDKIDKIALLINSKLYPLLDKMNTDLNEVFNTVFDGPLFAVDGFALTRLNAAVLEGEIPDSFNIAYKDELNDFSRGQQIVWDDDEEPFWKFGFGDLLVDPIIDPTSYFRIGSITDGEFYFSQNAFYDGAAFLQDSAAVDSLIFHFADGELSLEWWDNVLGDFRNTWTIAGTELLCANFADTAQFSFVIKDDNDVFRFGEDCVVDGINVGGYVAIPAKIATQIPPSGDANADGIIVIDKTNNYLVFYHSGLRYRVAGVAFP